MGAMQLLCPECSTWGDASDVFPCVATQQSGRCTTCDAILWLSIKATPVVAPIEGQTAIDDFLGAE